MANVWSGAAASLPKHEVDPISRIEGHLGVKVAVDGSGNIIDANAHGNLWRGFENFLLGRQANDAITFTQRICGVCPVPHGMTSTYAIDNVLGYSQGHITFETDANGYGVPAKAVLIRNLVLSAEFLMSSITHFYHLAAPSYVQGPAIPPWTPYFDTSYYHATLQSANTGGAGATKSVVPSADAGSMLVWDAVIISYVRALKIRRMTFEAGALFAGRMPMTSCYVAGGVTNDGTADLSARCAKFKTLIRAVGDFIVKEYVPIALVLGMLYQDFDSQTMALTGTATAMKASNRGHGGGLGRFLAWGAFPSTAAKGNTLALPGGVYDVNDSANNFTVLNKAEVLSKFVASAAATSVQGNLTEDIANARYAVASQDTAAYGAGTAAYPGSVSRTKPNRSNGYTYIKAPRWKGLACEVGPFARLVVGGMYPVDGRTLASVVPGYTAYVNAGALDLGMIAPEIAAGLTNSGTALGVNLVTAVNNWVLSLKGGLSTMDRLRARALESLVLVQAMVGSINKTAPGTYSWNNDGWIDDLDALTGSVALDTAGSTCNTKAIPTGSNIKGWGATEAPRGALMHQCTITNGKIVAYQCIVPTTWNGSPKDSGGNNGAIEAAVIGAPFTGATSTFRKQDGTTSAGAVGGVEVLRIAQSFDPCIACAIH